MRTVGRSASGGRVANPEKGERKWAPGDRGAPWGGENPPETLGKGRQKLLRASKKRREGGLSLLDQSSRFAQTNMLTGTGGEKGGIPGQHSDREKKKRKAGELSEGEGLI